MVRKRLLLIVSILMTVALVACSSDDVDENNADELKMLDVEFDVPETTDVGEAVPLEAFVTYGDDPVTEPQEVEYEIWEMCDQDNSVHEEPTNNGDGTYTLEYTFDKDGVYEVYAHTTAHDMHTMPKKQITVGEGGEYDCDEDDESGHEHHEDEHD